VRGLSFGRESSVMTARLTLACTTLFLSCATALAQPRMHGCLVLRDGAAPPRPQALTPNERDLIDETIARSDTFDILHYDISLDVTDYTGQAITASTTVTYAARMEGQSGIRFDLVALTVDSVIGANGPLAFTHDGQFLNVQLEDVPVVGEEEQLTVHYHGQPIGDPSWGGFYFASNYIYNLGIGLTTVPPNFGKVWYPCFDSFMERAAYTFHVKSAGGRWLLGQGDFIGEVQLGGDTVVRSYDLPYSIPTHVSAVAVANYAENNFTHTGAYGDIPVSLRAKPTQLSAMVGKFGDLGACIDALEHWYGPYPYGRIGYVLTTDGALEIVTNIAYPDFMPGQSVGRNRGLYAHELGHHWWGDKVTPRVHNHMWLKEGPAEYSGHLFEEWLNGREAMVNMVKDNLLDILTTAHGDDDGYQALSPMPDEHIYGTHTYYKGAAVMHNLRGYLGDSLFREAMRESQVRLADTVITPEMWRDTMELITGRDLHPFFDDWVFSPGYSVFEVRSFTAQEGDVNWLIDLRIGQKLYGTAGLHGDTPLDLTLIGADGQTHESLITASGLLTELSVVCPFEPVMAVLNRHQRLNQARMDHEINLVPGVAFSSALPRVEFRLYATALTDTTLVRVDHIWSGADEDLGWSIAQVSGTHYWNVDGLWPEGTVLRARFMYLGSTPGQFDQALINGDETGMVMVWRPNADAPWQIHPDQVLTAGSTTNGTGWIDVNTLYKGQYAFAKASGFIGVEEQASAAAFAVFPVPADEAITVRLNKPANGALQLKVLDAQGKLVMHAVRQTAAELRIDTRALAPGAYTLQMAMLDGAVLGARSFHVAR